MFRVLLLTTLFILTLLSNLNARTWYVKPDSTGKAINIQAAIDSCAHGDTVLVGPGTYKGDGNRDIDFKGKGIVVMSELGPDSTIIDCEGSEGDNHRCFYFHSGEDSTSVLEGFTITGGYYPIYLLNYTYLYPTDNSGQPIDENGGGICCVFSSPTIVNNVIANNQAVSGGGISCSSSKAKIINNDIYYNNASFYGSGIACHSCSLSIIGNNIVSNGDHFYWSTGGGGISCSGGSYIVKGNLIKNNRTGSHGQGLYCRGCNITIFQNEIIQNCCWCDFCGSGGGIYAVYVKCSILNNTIISNGNSEGGGIYISVSDTSVIEGNEIEGNITKWIAGWGYGGGIFSSGLDLVSIINNSIKRNSAQYGGGIYISNSALIKGNIITNNRAFYYNLHPDGSFGGNGGGIYCASSPSIIGNIICFNSCFENTIEEVIMRGAGVFCDIECTPVIQRNIITCNEFIPDGKGGGIYCESNSVPDISCCDVWGNDFGNYGGSITDQTSINGNISADPIFCYPDEGVFTLHVQSPCLPGNHPDGYDCGLIGALGEGCDYLATLLQNHHASYIGTDVIIEWELSEVDPDIAFAIYRSALPDDK